jgi:hypothetical protein
MSKNQKQTAMPQSPGSGDWGETTATTATKSEPAKVAPAPSEAEVIQTQIAEKTREDVARSKSAMHQDEPPHDVIAAAVKEVEKRLVDDLPKSFALLKEVDGLKVETRQEVKIKRAVVQRVKQHCFALQQGQPTLPPPTANQLSANKRASLGLPQRRAERLKQLRADFRPAFPKVDGSVHPLKRLLGEPEIQAAISDYATKWRAYVVAFLEVEEDGLLSPHDRLDRLNQELAGCRDIARLKELRSEIAEVSASMRGVLHGNDVRATRAVLSNLLTPARKSLVSALELSLKQLQGYLTEAIETERAFLAKSGVTWEPTAISRRVQEAIDRVSRVLEGHKAVTVGGAVGVVESNVKSLFGITID